MEGPLDNDQSGRDEGGPVPPGSAQLGDPCEILLRHIRSACYHNGVASSQNFEPMPKDRWHLSVERGSMIEAATAHSRWTSWGRDSVAVYGVTVGEFDAYGAPSFHVPINNPGEENPEHALVRYPANRSQARKLATVIKGRARKVFEP